METKQTHYPEGLMGQGQRAGTTLEISQKLDKWLYIFTKIVRGAERTNLAVTVGFKTTLKYCCSALKTYNFTNQFIKKCHS